MFTGSAKLPDQAPTAVEVRGHLARVLESEEFQRADRSRDLLQFVVDSTLLGQATALNSAFAFSGGRPTTTRRSIPWSVSPWAVSG